MKGLIMKTLLKSLRITSYFVLGYMAHLLFEAFVLTNVLAHFGISLIL
jgi:hypothetical protein